MVVVRYEGPKGGPGMQEMLAVTGAIIGAGLGDSTMLLTDGRFSGASRGPVHWACGSGGGCWRTHRPASRRRHRVLQCGDPRPQCATLRRRTCAAQRRVDGAAAELRPGRSRQVREAGVVRIGWRGNDLEIFISLPLWGRVGLGKKISPLSRPSKHNPKSLCLMNMPKTRCLAQS